MARASTVFCKVCDGAAVIRKSERLNNELSVCYCECKNPQCRHRFVVNMEFSHTTRSSFLTKDRLLKLALSQLSREDKRELIGLLSE